MKNYIIFLLCVINSIVIGSSQEKLDQLKSAEALYAQKEFDKATAVLRDMHPKNAIVLYNMGNCAYKKDEYEQALSYWQCAQVHAPSALKENIAYNIALVKNKLPSNTHTSFLKILYDWYYAIPLIVFQILFLLCWFLLLLFLKMYKNGTRYRSLSFGLLLIITIMSGIALGFKYHIIKQRRGIIMEHGVSLFAGPDEQYHVLGSLDKASQVTVYEERSSWCKISHEKEFGWVRKDSIVVV